MQERFGNHEGGEIFTTGSAAALSTLQGDARRFEQEMEKWAEWAAQACLANQLFSLFLFKASTFIGKTESELKLT